MSDDIRARISEHSPMDVINRILGDMGDDIDRITVVCVDKSGDHSKLYSNARSEAEMFGMMHVGLNFAQDMDQED